MLLTINGTRIELIRGDITKEIVDAIVNAANAYLIGGGGVDAAIHQAGGSEILKECQAIVNVKGILPVGEAVVTGAGALQAKYVIHTVGPIYGKDKEPEIFLRNAYYNALKRGRDLHIKSIAFPSISTGAYGYPFMDACKIALKTIIEFLTGEKHFYQLIRLVFFKESDLHKAVKICETNGYLKR